MDNDHDHTTPGDQAPWKILLATTLLLATLVTVLMFEKERLLPSLYASSHHEQVPEEAQEHTTAETPATEPKDTVAHVETPPKEIVHPPATEVASGSGRFSLIAGSFRSEDRALKYKETIDQGFGRQSSIVPVSLHAETFYRVIVLRSDSREQVASLKDQLGNAGYTCWVLEK